MRRGVWAQASDFDAELGSLRVAQLFPRDVRAIYASLHSVADAASDRGKDLLHGLHHFAERDSDMKMLDSSFTLYLNTDIRGPRNEGLCRDTFVADVLDYFARDSSELQEALVGHRFELFLRILNAALSYTPLDESPARTIAPSNGIGEVQIERLTSVFFSKGDPYELVKNISTECRIQLCETVLMYMSNVRVQRVSFLLTENTVALKLLVPTLSKVSPWRMDSSVLPHVCALNRRVAEYVSQNSSAVTSDALKDSEWIAKAIVYVTRILDVMFSEYRAAYPGKLSNNLNGIEEYDNVHGVYMTSFNSLVDSINEAVAEVGFPHELVGIAERSRWQQLSQHREICEEAVSARPEESSALLEICDEMSRMRVRTGEIAISIR
ncbi:hypothetical protein EST38_g13092 [Candolleomyces aberdarensis]|uniref:Uncharacterized protein n=1 Tax=Candolleomyces aberdarensis TaxID=2316362 RepID=A0A4Q2D1Y9_9AGAR|nr:hypothetical protein EST38_g13092 [Candolleomyces aberdarensis]